MFVLRSAGLLTCGGVHGVDGVAEAGAVLVVGGGRELRQRRVGGQRVGGVRGVAWAVQYRVNIVLYRVNSVLYRVNIITGGMLVGT